MNTKKLRTTLLIVLALAAVCITSVLGTLSYLKAQDTVHNTFTVGNVDMDLDETFLDRPADDGVAEGAFEQFGNDGEDIDTHNK